MPAEEEQQSQSLVRCPEWVKPEIFEDILKNNVPQYSKITKFNAHGALAPGENYATEVLRVEIEVELDDRRKRNISYILKASLQNAQFKAIMKTMRTFEKETGMFMEIVPEMEQIYKSAGLDVKFSANAYHLKAPEDVECLLLEDLCVRGFKNVYRLDCLDMEHTKCVLKKMAQWHAASAVRVETKGKYDDFYAIGPFRAEGKAFMEQINNSTGAILKNVLHTYKGHEIWQDSVVKYHNNLTDEFYRSANFDPNEFNVLNHGDLWSNNIMFQYDAFGKIKETYFVDFQIPKYGSPTQDLHYFLLSSTKFELKLKQFEYFIKYYHDHLIEHLALLQYPKRPPSLKDLHILLHKHSVWAYGTAVGVMSAVLVDPMKTANFENFINDSAEGKNFKMMLYTNDRYRQHIEAIFPWLYNRGALEC